MSKGWITVDGVLAPEHDAAHVHWGDDCRMPTKQEIDDLNSKCTWTKTTKNGVDGLEVRGKGDYASNSIFLPLAGLAADVSHYFPGYYVYYWSSTIEGEYGKYSWSLYYNYLTGENTTDDKNYRYGGSPIRPVQGLPNSERDVLVANRSDPNRRQLQYR